MSAVPTDLDVDPTDPDAGPTVLVVDDDRELADMYAESLSAEYAVRTACDGEGALEALDASVAVVLLDRRMPGLSGDELLEEIRARDVDARVVMLTAVDPDFDVLEMAFDEYVVKPVTHAEIRETVSRMVSLGTQDEQLQQYHALVSKKLALESRKGASQLQASDDYLELLDTIADRRDRLDDELATRVEAAASASVFSGRDRSVDHLSGVDGLVGEPAAAVAPVASNGGEATAAASDGDASGDEATADGFDFPMADVGSDHDADDGSDDGSDHDADDGSDDDRPAADGYAALRESDPLYAALLDNVRDAVFVVGPDRELLDGNAAFVDRFGHEPEAVRGEPSSMLYADPAAFESGEGPRRPEPDDPSAHQPVEYRDADGRVFTGDTNVFRFRNPSGDVVAHAAVVRADDGVGDADAATPDAEEVTVLTRLLRHEIGNDLALLTGYLEQLGETVPDDERAPLDRALAVTARSADHLRDFGELLGALYEGDRVSGEGVAVVPVVEAAVEAVRENAAEATIELGPLEAASVRANDLLDVVVRNLLDNAIRHNDADEPRLEVAVETDGELARIRVEDDGPGVPDDVREAVLEPGEKGPESEGLGLGLYLVDRLVSASGGAIHIEDRDPRGTVVVVELELAD